jgi:hypothetical protein
VARLPVARCDISGGVDLETGPPVKRLMQDSGLAGASCLSLERERACCLLFGRKSLSDCSRRSR